MYSNKTLEKLNDFCFTFNDTFSARQIGTSYYEPTTRKYNTGHRHNGYNDDEVNIFTIQKKM